MENFDAVRRLARTKHGETRKEAGNVLTAASLLVAAAKVTGIHCLAVPEGDSLLQGGEAILVPSAQSIFYNESVGYQVASFYQAHEFAHYWLDDAAVGACSSKEVNVNTPDEQVPLGIQRVEGYGPRERRETQANVFAREFLLPIREARRLYVEEQLSALEISESVGVPITLVYQQLALALLIPEEVVIEGKDKIPRQAQTHDESQRQAAEVENGPLLLEAGPGTGKTRTLISRIETLLKRSIEPANILALTFSNKAAGEIRERIEVASPNAAAAIWAGTFHAFGLEILRKWGHLIGLPKDVRLVDPNNALFLLETALPNLHLNYYLNLMDPAIDLQHILIAISRAKDELISPAAYRTYGESMVAIAGANEDERIAGEKVLEVAGVYEAYERLLRESQVVDFADLINQSIELLNSQPVALAELRIQYNHILVDEYQDVNHACAVLLKLLAGDGKNLWVVGDARQSIYRFRGASPKNIREFERDFPKSQRMALDTNYRSQEHVVRLIEAFAPKMLASVGGLPPLWRAHRGSQGGDLKMEVASDLGAESVGLAQEIERQRARGIPYKDQAILCRSHTQLARFASLLEAQGIPVLYLGDIFERPEIRDLLSLLSFVSEPERGGLLRVAAFPEYSIPLSDVRSVLSYSEFAQCEPLVAIRRLSEIRDLTEAGRIGLEKLVSHLEGVGFATSPSWFLSAYLFDRSRYLAPSLDDPEFGSQRRRLAVFQLIQFALEQDNVNQAVKGDPKRRLLGWIRRLEILGDERQLRQMPAAANDMEAVRMLTVHSSKGLEFGTVYLPGLGTQMFPTSQRYNPCPPPIGMLSDDPSEAYKAEEECIFFVAISRARDFLCLSRAERYSAAKKTSVSSHLLHIAPYLPSSPEGLARWNKLGPILDPPPPVLALARTTGDHAGEDLDQYLRCPRQYLYQRILGLSGAREDTAYISFHRCVYHVLRWMNHRADGTPFPQSAEISSELKSVWQEQGPLQHPYNLLYWKAATEIIARAVARGARTSISSIQPIWNLIRPGGVSIKIRPDHVEVAQGLVLVRRIRTGRPPKTITIDPIYALYHAGAAAAYPGAQIKVDTHFLTTDDTVDIELKAKIIGDRLQKYDAAVADIVAGQFPAEPKDERLCPRCPQYFICAALPPLGAESQSVDEK